MPFWDRAGRREVEAAKAEAEAALHPGWSIHRFDREYFDAPRGMVETYGVCGVGPAEESAFVMAVGKANAYRQFVRGMRGEIELQEGWAAPVPELHDPRPSRGSFRIKAVDDPNVIAAKAEVDATLPAGWTLFDNDRERYFFPHGHLEIWGLTAAGPDGQVELVFGLGEAGGLQQLALRLRGELEITDAWMPPMEYLIRDRR